ncbi:MAG: TrkA C-terminal domain-containing protein [Odoribacter sp.]|nr:TrkA C-terminal domain-containing protein [Odoribacter sp.]
MGKITYQIELSQYEIEPGSCLIGKSVKELDIQRKTECLVTGIERECGIIATSNTADIILEEGDTLWLAGEKVKLKFFEENLFA